jgi:hypothetical protein
MGILTDDMKRPVREAGLGFHATVSEHGSPNLSPKRHDRRLGRRSPLLRGHPIAADGGEHPPRFRRRGQRRRSVREEGLPLQGPRGGLRTWNGRLRRGYRASAGRGLRDLRGAGDRGDRGPRRFAAHLTRVRRWHSDRGRDRERLARTLRAAPSEGMTASDGWRTRPSSRREHRSSFATRGRIYIDRYGVKS